jgi:hypothetical protein
MRNYKKIASMTCKINKSMIDLNSAKSVSEFKNCGKAIFPTVSAKINLRKNRFSKWS